VEFRAENAMGRELEIDGASVHLRLSPNTQRMTKPAKDAERPADLAEVFDLIARARQGILFLLFQPGTPSVLDAILDAESPTRSCSCAAPQPTPSPSSTTPSSSSTAPASGPT
jgi:hypothetical protein